MKPSFRNSPDNLILHVRANNLSSEKSSMEIAESTRNQKHVDLKAKYMTSVFQQLF